MSRIHYFGDGYSLSDEKNPNRQATWVCIFNPGKKLSKMKFTFYYEDCEPTVMFYEMPAEMGRSIALYECKEVYHNKRFGAKIECSEPLVIQITTGYYGVEDKADWYTRAMHSVICSDTLSKINYYSDAFVIDKEEMRLKEPEWAFLLNPGEETAKVVLYAYYNDGQKETYNFTIPPQRLLPVFMDKLIVINKLFGAKYISNVPIAIQETRLIEEEDRKTIRACFSVMAKPGPLIWQDDNELSI